MVLSCLWHWCLGRVCVSVVEVVVFLVVCVAFCVVRFDGCSYVGIMFYEFEETYIPLS